MQVTISFTPMYIYREQKALFGKTHSTHSTNGYMMGDTGFQKQHRMFGENYEHIIQIIWSHQLFQRPVKKHQCALDSLKLPLTIPK